MGRKSRLSISRIETLLATAAAFFCHRDWATSAGRSRFAGVDSYGSLLLPGANAQGATREFPNQLIDENGNPPGPHFTYLGDPLKVSCTAMVPAPLSQPSQPTVQEAITFCNSVTTCAGFTYLTKEANNALNGIPDPAATYCLANSFVAGSKSATSAIAYLKYVYSRCDLQVSVPTSIAGHYGTIVDTRRACVRHKQRVRFRGDVPSEATETGSGVGKLPEVVLPPPYRKVLIGGVEFTVGKEAFMSEAEAKAASRDGGAHTRSEDTTLTTFYIPGATTAVYDEGKWHKPFGKDMYYPLYKTEAEARAASTAFGGDGLADTIGPGTSYPHGPDHWADGSYTVYYMPEWDSKSPLKTRKYHRYKPLPWFTTWVEAKSIDGYYPLYDSCAQAAAFSYDPTASDRNFNCVSYGPGSEAGVPVKWSTGEHRLYYMPKSHALGPITSYAGTHLDGSTSYPSGLRSGLYDFYNDNEVVRRKLPVQNPYSLR